ncbi:hypothetical protein C9J12_27100 [Photobacterium frigidiphilum]|uniref:Uncharacterized protein n=1 Tax=Photobacterium frigidiphilum TaxID=264736 RepID=A0A2T3J743_9GAMM|nr:hypothetical protein [Photobacterium frigidiphilum]PSU44540.1 hypothetical protein C9J12_27100 [Photobacterium frigidiphilum]
MSNKPAAPYNDIPASTEKHIPISLIDVPRNNDKPKTCIADRFLNESLDLNSRFEGTFHDVRYGVFTAIELTQLKLEIITYQYGYDVIQHLRQEQYITAKVRFDIELKPFLDNPTGLMQTRRINRLLERVKTKLDTGGKLSFIEHFTHLFIILKNKKGYRYFTGESAFDNYRFETIRYARKHYD